MIFKIKIGEVVGSGLTSIFQNIGREEEEGRFYDFFAFRVNSL